MGPIRGLQLALSTDTFGLGLSTLPVCVCVYVCRWMVCRFCSGGEQSKRNTKKSIISILVGNITGSWLKYELWK